MIHKTYTTILGTLLAVGTAFGQWQVVEDFQTVTGDTIPRFIQFPETEGGLVIDAFDPEDATNRSLYVDAGLRGVKCNAIFVAVPLPQPVALGSTASFKFDFWQAGTSYDLNAGLSATAFVTDENNIIIDPATPAFNEFEAQIRMGGRLDVRDGGSFRTTNTSTPVGEWMTIYLVVSNMEGNQTIKGYLRTIAGGIEPILIPVLDEIRDQWKFRVGRNQALTHFYLGSSNACDRGYASGDIFLFDNVYIDYSGVNLDGDEPPGATWAGMPVVDGWVDTGSFMGNVYPMGDWVYIQRLGNWVYLPEANVGETGAWAYAVK
jgi:hypothetical protein